MATSKPLSTISYNTKEFLIGKLESWYKAHKIQAYQVIFHVGEDGDKNHAHVRIEPNTRLDPLELTQELKEIDPHNDKPLCCRPWRPSVEEHWILYVVHNKEYLNIMYGGGEKGEKLPYTWENVICSELYDVETMFIRACQKILQHSNQSIAEKLESG